MIDDVSDIADLYSGSLQAEHTRLERHQLARDLTWLDLLFELSLEKSILGPSRHLLYVGKKKWRL
jgi:hypothetical protein